MGYAVARNRGWAKEEVPFVVRRLQPHNEGKDVVRTFAARMKHVEGPDGGRWRGYEDDEEVRQRAQAFADELNRGGAARERSLRGPEG